MDAAQGIQNEVDYLILDYLAHHASEAVLNGLEEPAGSNRDVPVDDNAEQHLQLFDSYFTLCAPRLQSGYHSSAPLSTVLRLQLLQFAVSFDAYCHPSRAITRFSAASLARLRGESKVRASLWWEQRDEEDPEWMIGEIDLGDDIFKKLESKQVLPPSQTAHELCTSERSYDQVPTLCDLIPAFIKLTSTRMKLMARNDDSTPLSSDNLSVRTEWLFLAAEMMLQASLDDFSGSSSYPGLLQNRMHEIFSWGFVLPGFGMQPTSDDAMDIDGEGAANANNPQDHGGHSDNESECSNCQTDAQHLAALNRVFRNSQTSSPPGSPNQNEEQSKSWESIRRNYMILIPDVLLARKLKKQASGLTPEMARLEGDHSRQAFHRSLVRFLNSLVTSIAPPLLLQLESNDVNGDDSEQDLWIEELELTGEESARLRAIARSFG